MIARRPCNAHTYWGAIKGNLFTQKCCIHGFAIKLHLQRTPPFAGQQNYFHSCLTWVICCLSCVWVATWSPNLSFPQITNNPLFWLQTCSACRRWYVRNLTELWHYSHMAPVFLNQTTTPAWLCEHIIGQTKEQTFLACSSTSFIPQRSPPPSFRVPVLYSCWTKVWFPLQLQWSGNKFLPAHRYTYKAG